MPKLYIGFDDALDDYANLAHMPRYEAWVFWPLLSGEVVAERVAAARREVRPRLMCSTRSKRQSYLRHSFPRAPRFYLVLIFCCCFLAGAPRSEVKAQGLVIMDADLQPFTERVREPTPAGDAPVSGRFEANPSDPLLLSRSKVVGRNAVLDRAVERQAERFNIDPFLIYALVWQESGGRAGATSPKGASGVVQLMPATAARFGVQNPRHIPEAVRGGVEYLVWLLDRYDGNVSLALAGYNAGEGAVDAYLMGRTVRTRDGRIINPRAIRTPDGIPPYRETRNYVRGIAYRYRVLRAGYERELARKM